MGWHEFRNKTNLLISNALYAVTVLSRQKRSSTQLLSIRHQCSINHKSPLLPITPTHSCLCPQVLTAVWSVVDLSDLVRKTYGNTAYNLENVPPSKQVWTSFICLHLNSILMSFYWWITTQGLNKPHNNVHTFEYRLMDVRKLEVLRLLCFCYAVAIGCYITITLHRCIHCIATYKHVNVPTASFCLKYIFCVKDNCY
jgi:hypothetical protein